MNTALITYYAEKLLYKVMSPNYPRQRLHYQI